MAIVLALETVDGEPYDGAAFSTYDNSFSYTAGATVSVDDFDGDRYNECAPGIHFFINRQEAVEYQ